MHQKFIGTIAAISIIITGFAAAPARANDQNLNGALAALLGIAVVGAIIHEKKKDKKRSRAQVVHKEPQKKTYDARTQTRHIKPRPLPRRLSARLLPGQCLRSYETTRGAMRIFGQRCLEQNYKFTHSLPQHCERRVRTDRGMRFGYAARCLNRQGYELARR